MRKREVVELKLSENIFYKNEVIVTANNIKLLILSTPHRTYWRRFLEIISFGIYKTPVTYKCKVLQ